MLNVMADTLTEHDQRLVHSLQALGDKTRFRIFKILQADKKLCVGEIAGNLGISSSAVSQHFRTFELLGLVKKERSGQKVCYVLNQTDELSQKLINLTNS